MKRLATLPLLLGLLTGCTPDGYPSTDTEMWAVTVIPLGVLGLLAWVAHCGTRP